MKKAKDDERFRILYAHNGGGWDWLSLCEYLLREGRKERQHITGIVAASKLVTMTVKLEKQFTIHFCDSLQLLRSPLAELSKKFGKTNKIDLGGKFPHEVYETDRDLYNSYVKADTESLLEVIETALELVNEKVSPIGSFGYTIGSTAMKVFKSMLKTEIAVPWEMRVKEFLRKGYKGGRVEVFKSGHFKEVTVYDINSLYPFAMLTTDVPVSDRGVWTETFDKMLAGCYDISFRQRNRDVPPTLVVDGEGKYEGQGIYYSPEISLLKEVDPNAEIIVHQGYTFLDSEKLFQDYVNKLYQLRLSDPSGPVSLLCKYLLNSLYGKFAQNPNRTTIVAVNNFDEIYSLIGDESHVEPVNEELGVYAIRSDHTASFEHVGIAGMITSQARVLLYRGILDAGVENVVYCDTDSVHTTGTLNSNLVGTEIGKFKVEFKGEGVYAGKKLYALRKSEWVSIGQRWNTKLRAKGVTIGGRNGSSICFDDFVSMATGGERIKATYQQPATASQVFGGSAPCRFEKRTRTIGRT